MSSRCSNLTMRLRRDTKIFVTCGRSETRIRTGQGWIVVFLFVAIFSLPLHSHLRADPSHVDECSCLHGCRTAIGLAPAVLDLTVGLQYFIYNSPQPRLVFSRALVNFLSIRAPPIF